MNKRYFERTACGRGVPNPFHSLWRCIWHGGTRDEAVAALGLLGVCFLLLVVLALTLPLTPAMVVPPR